MEYSRTLDQTCHACGLSEAAGDFCTRCGARTVGDWHRVRFSDAQLTAMGRNAFQKRPSGANGAGTRGDRPLGDGMGASAVSVAR